MRLPAGSLRPEGMLRARVLVVFVLTACGHAGRPELAPDASRGGSPDSELAPVDSEHETDASLATGDAGISAGCTADPYTLPTGVTAVTFAQLVPYFAPGTTTASVGSFAVTSRSRACDAVTGCGAWSSTPASVMATDGTREAIPSAGVPTLGFEDDESIIDVTMYGGGTFYIYCEGANDDGASSWGCNGISPQGLVWYDASYEGSPRVDNTTLIEWQGTVASDGSFQFVTELASQLGTDLGGSNNDYQIAVCGQL